MLLRGAILFLAVLFCAMVIEAQSAPTDESAGTASVADSATYSTGRGGARLKWLVQRADTPAEDSAVRQTQYTASSVPSRRVRVAQSQPSNGGLDANERRRTTSPAPAAPLTDDLLPEEPATDGGQSDLSPREVPTQRPSPMPNAAPAPRTKPAEKYNIPRAQVGPNSTDKLLEQYYSKQRTMEDVCPSPKDLKPIADLSTDIEPKGGNFLPKECPLGNDTYQQRNFPPITYTWTASGLCHKPLYFEDVQLERYGHMAGPWLQPFASAAHFFFTVPILPYKMGLETPNECMYTLGYYRAGNCAPYLFDPIPISARGALFEAGAWVGGVFAFP